MKTFVSSVQTYKIVTQVLYNYTFLQARYLDKSLIRDSVGPFIRAFNFTKSQRFFSMYHIISNHKIASITMT